MKSLRSTTRQNNTKRILIIVGSLLLLAFAGIGTYAYMNQGDEESSGTDTVEPAPSELSDEDARDKEQFVEESERAESSPDADERQSITVEVDTYQQGDEVVYQTKVRGASDGTCALDATNGSRQISRSAEIMYQAQYSTCAGFSIPVSELGSGTWQLVLNVKSGDSRTRVTSSVRVE